MKNKLEQMKNNHKVRMQGNNEDIRDLELRNSYYQGCIDTLDDVMLLMKKEE